jgi:type II secretory pathway component PulK
MLVIFSLLAMLAIGFSFSTRAEYNALETQIGMSRARHAAVSGIESMILILRERFEDPNVWYDDPNLFSDQPIEYDQTLGDERKDSWRYSIVGYNLDAQDFVRFGVTDEASKVNLNVASEAQLLRLPGMTRETVDSLLDWRESGDKAREEGAKDDYYLNLKPEYQCKKAPLDTIEELLLVKGFTADILFGEDMNRNGLLDANENDGKASLPIDNSDGQLDRGLYPFVTVYSREPEVTDTDPYQPRINIKDWPDAVIRPMMEKTQIRPEVIDFIIKMKADKIIPGRSPASLLEFKYKKPKKSTDNTSSQPGDNTSDNTSDNKTKDWVESPVTVSDMPLMLDVLTTGVRVHDDGFVYGRININTAPRTVLRTIGWLTETEIDSIMQTRAKLAQSDKRTIAWLITQGALSVDKFKKVAPLFTARSYQFMIEALGYRDKQAYQARIQTVVELRLPRVQYIYYRDLTGLGRAYDIAKFGEQKIVTRQ